MTISWVVPQKNVYLLIVAEGVGVFWLVLDRRVRDLADLIKFAEIVTTGKKKRQVCNEECAVS